MIFVRAYGLRFREQDDEIWLVLGVSCVTRHENFPDYEVHDSVKLQLAE